MNLLNDQPAPDATLKGDFIWGAAILIICIIFLLGFRLGAVSEHRNAVNIERAKEINHGQ